METSPKWCCFPHLQPISPRSVPRVTLVRKIPMGKWEDFFADQWASYALLLTLSLLLNTCKSSRILSSFFILGISSTPSEGENPYRQGGHNHMIIISLMNRHLSPEVLVMFSLWMPKRTTWPNGTTNGLQPVAEQVTPRTAIIRGCTWKEITSLHIVIAR